MEIFVPQWGCIYSCLVVQIGPWQICDTVGIIRDSVALLVVAFDTDIYQWNWFVHFSTIFFLCLSHLIYSRLLNSFIILLLFSCLRCCLFYSVDVVVVLLVSVVSCSILFGVSIFSLLSFSLNLILGSFSIFWMLLEGGGAVQGCGVGVLDRCCCCCFGVSFCCFGLLCCSSWFVVYLF